MTDCLLTYARLPGRSGLHHIYFEGGAIAAITLASPAPEALPRVPQFDFEGDWLSLGGIDLQINGGLGLAFPDLHSDDHPNLDKIAAYLWDQGVDGFCPTLVTTSIQKIHQALAVIAASPLRHPQPHRAQILGVHLEGPCLNPSKRGAHPAAHLQPLSREMMASIIGDYGDLVKIVTLAPELDPSGDAIAFLTAQNIIVSLGHSLATASDAHQAFDQGATMVTHAFNAMPPLHHRDPGLLGAALTRATVRCGVIADGEHVCPLMLDLLLRMERDGVFLVSDALAPIGLPDGDYPWDDRTITVTHGTARLDAHTLAGTTLPLLAGVENLVRWGICEPGRAIALATEAPRRAIAQAGLTRGQTGPFLRWSRHPQTAALHWQRFTLPSNEPRPSR
ncbi:N-acetylglucosamine-6-phosphate deacetylase [Spirulina major CS-329]|uniref:N-acetylglucosamine-6-phosphate deacetylase n=1 Tax=Spirulina TaxID=1154 RepID=UPI00232DB6DF|nr:MULTISPECIES: N-acetylglucosamine-6-phosphate deacetylase [Spirulina]MDB9496894.1 N-acetylglucosamine-6-phosphate deacetylase [Spirulina subsalsa CS-330]MDB9502369.1 N-acetylglucosamine-6-phosphate deacetylase [Spirulina major CS-329]